MGGLAREVSMRELAWEGQHERVSMGAIVLVLADRQVSMYGISTCCRMCVLPE